MVQQVRVILNNPQFRLSEKGKFQEIFGGESFSFPGDNISLQENLNTLWESAKSQTELVSDGQGGTKKLGVVCVKGEGIAEFIGPEGGVDEIVGGSWVVPLSEISTQNQWDFDGEGYVFVLGEDFVFEDYLLGFFGQPSTDPEVVSLPSILLHSGTYEMVLSYDQSGNLTSLWGRLGTDSSGGRATINWVSQEFDGI